MSLSLILIPVAIGREKWPARERFKQRSSVERVNGALKDRYGGRHIRVQGATKVACHLFFGILVLTVEQLLRLYI